MGNVDILFSFPRAFSFRKKTPSGVNKVEVPTKVTLPDVLADRNVNVPKNNLVTKSPLTFSNKLERPQTNKINTIFPISSKGKSDGISQKDKCAPPRQNPFAISATKATAVPSKGAGKQPAGGSQSAPSNLDTSLAFPMDDWDDLDDFETPVKSRNNSFTSKQSEKPSNPVTASSEEQTGFAGKPNLGPTFAASELSSDCADKGVEEIRIETAAPEHVANGAAASPGPNPDKEPVESIGDGSPVRRPRRRLPSHLSKLDHFKSVLSDSEEDNDVKPECVKETTGSNRTSHLFLPSVPIMTWCLALMNHCFNLSDNKTKWIDPKVIELDNSDSENDFDFIPPSPTPEEILYFSQTRLVSSIRDVSDSLCLFETKTHIM